MTRQEEPEDSEPGQSIPYILGGIGLAVAGVAWALAGPTSAVRYKVVEGISVFAALYVIAQAAERVAEWTIELLSLVPNSPGKVKKEALRKIRAANSTLNCNPTLADFGPQLAQADPATMGAAVSQAVSASNAATAQKEQNETKVTAARKDIAFLAHGVSLALCALAVNALNYRLLSQVGAEGVPAGIDRLLTALAAAGGTKALHELIGGLQKAKESSEAKA